MKKSNEENISTKGSSEMGNDVDVILQPSSVCIPFLSLKDKDGENCEMQLCPDGKTRQEAKQCSNKIISRERQELFESFRSRNLHLLKYSSGDYYSPPVNMKIVNKQNVSLDASMKTDIIICDCIKQGDKYGMYASEPSNQCLPFESIKDIDNSEFEEAQLAQEIQEIKKAKVRKNLFNFEDDLQLASVQQRKPKHNAVYLSHNVLTGKKKGSKQDTSKQSSCEMETVISSSNKSSSSHLQTTDDERNKTHQDIVRFLWISDLQRKAFDLLKDHNISLMFPSLAYLRRYHAILILGEDASHLLRHQQTCFLHSIASVLNIHLNEILVLHSTEPNCHLKAFDKNG